MSPPQDGPGKAGAIGSILALPTKLRRSGTAASNTVGGAPLAYFSAEVTFSLSPTLFHTLKTRPQEVQVGTAMAE
jgi:hypothetical protein